MSSFWTVARRIIAVENHEERKHIVNVNVFHVYVHISETFQNHANVHRRLNSKSKWSRSFLTSGTMQRMCPSARVGGLEICPWRHHVWRSECQCEAWLVTWPSQLGSCLLMSGWTPCSLQTTTLASENRVSQIGWLFLKCCGSFSLALHTISSIVSTILYIFVTPDLMKIIPKRWH